MKTSVFQDFLKQVLPTFKGAAGACPDENALSAWLEAAGRRKKPDPRVRRHVLGCPDCLEKALLLAELTGEPLPLRAVGLWARLGESPALKPVLSAVFLVLLATAVYLGGLVPPLSHPTSIPTAPESIEAPVPPAESGPDQAGFTPPQPSAAGQPPVAAASGRTAPFEPPGAIGGGDLAKGLPAPPPPAAPAPPPMLEPPAMSRERMKEESAEARDRETDDFAPVPEMIKDEKVRRNEQQEAKGAADRSPSAKTAAPNASTGSGAARPPASPAPAQNVAPATAGCTDEGVSFAVSRAVEEKKQKGDKAEEGLTALLERLCPKALASSVRFRWNGHDVYSAEGYLVGEGVCNRPVRSIARQDARSTEGGRRDAQKWSAYKGIFIREGDRVIFYTYGR